MVNNIALFVSALGDQSRCADAVPTRAGHLPEYLRGIKERLGIGPFCLSMSVRTALSVCASRGIPTLVAAQYEGSVDSRNRNPSELR
jgi:hypothetical protein